MDREEILNVSLEAYKQEIDNLRASMQTLSKDSEEYKAIVSQIIQIHNNLNEAIKAGRIEINSLDDSYVNLSKSLSAAMQEIGNFEINNESFSSLESKIDEVGNAIADTTKKVREFTDDISAYADEINGISGEVKITFDNTSLDGYKEEIETLTSSLSTLSNESFSSLETNIEGIGDVIADTTKKVREFTDDVSAYNDEINGISSEVKITFDNTSLEGYKEVIESLSSSLSTLSKDSDEYKKVATQVMQVQESLNEAIKSGKIEVDGLDGVYANLSQTMSELISDINGVEFDNKSISEFSNDVNVLNDKLKSVSEGVGSLAVSLENYEKSLNDTMSKAGEGANAFHESLSAASPKEYKQLIDNLRMSLIGLSKDSEQYKEVSAQIAQMQQNLNDVMKVGKTNVDAVDGSYAKLSQTMSELKKEWKSMEIGSDAWVELGQRINEINDELKGADASVGVFSRNVGNYEQAFEEAFKSVAGNVKDFGGSLGSVAGDVLKLIPVIKQTTKVATASLSGIKKAIASTGIGLLIVAVSELAFHWNDLMKLFRSGKSDIEELTTANEKLNDSFKAQNQELETEIRFMKAHGANTQEVINAKKQLIKTQIAELESTLKLINARMAEIRTHSAFIAFIRGENKLHHQLAQEQKEILKSIEDLNRSYLGLIADSEIDNIEKGTKAFKDEKKALDDLIDGLKKWAKSDEQILTERYEKDLALMKKYHKDTTLLTKKYQEELNAIRAKGLVEFEEPDYSFGAVGKYEKLEEAIQKSENALNIEESKLERLNKKWNVALEKAKKGVKGAKEEADSIEHDVVEQQSRVWTAAIAFDRATKNNLMEQLKDAQEIYKDFIDAFDFDKSTIDQLSDNMDEYIERLSEVFGPEFKKSFEDNLGYALKYFSENGIESSVNLYTAMSAAFEEGKKSLDKMKTEVINMLKVEFGKDVYETTEELDAAIKEAYDTFQSLMDTFASNRFDAQIDLSAYRKELDDFKEAYKKFYLDFSEGETDIRDADKTIWAKLGFAPLQNDAAELESRKKLYSEYLDWLKLYKDELVNSRIELFKEQNTGATDEEIRVEREKIAFQVDRELKDKQLEYEKAYAEAEKAIIDYRIDNWMSLADSIGDITGSIGELFEIQIEQEKKKNIEAGMAEEEAEKIAEKQYERVQAMQIAEATISTISGALTALMEAQKLGFPMGPIVGAAQAAALTLAGIVEIQKIRQTNPYSKDASSTLGSSSASATYTAPVNVTPMQTNYNAEYTENMTGQRETEELRKALNTAKIRAYVVESDITGKQRRAQERRNESTF